MRSTRPTIHAGPSIMTGGLPAGPRPRPSAGRRIRPAAALALASVLALLLAACGSGEDAAAPATAPEQPGSPAPGSPAAGGPQSEDRQLTVDGTERTYRVITPTGDATVPVVVAIHDAGNTVDGMVQVTQFDRTATREGFAVVFPAAVEEAGNTWNAEFCCGAGPSVGVDDMAFLDAMLDELAADARLDTDRLYLAGVSNGAVMAYRYACERAERVAGVGSVAGTMDPDSCQPSEPVSVLEIHGTADEVVPYDGGEMPDFVQATLPAMGAEALTRRWAELNACAGDPAAVTEPPVTRMTWSECDGDSTVGLIAIEGGGHTWYAPEFGPTNGAVNATEEILRFFRLNT